MGSTTVNGNLIFVKEIEGCTGGLDSSSRTHSALFDVWQADGALPATLDCYTAVTTLAPASWDGMFPNSISYREDDGGTNHFLFTVGYNAKAPESTLRWGFDTTGGTIRMFTSKNTTRYSRTSRTAPDFQGAIGVKNTGKDAEPEGVDVVTPGLKLTATYKWPANTFGIAEAKVIAGMTGRTNNGTFYTFPAGELLFLGASASEIMPDVPTQVEYHFLASSNATGLTIGAVSGIAKKGHEYLWVAFEAEADTSANKLVQRPLGVYVERVYDETDFATLGIGTA